MQQLLFLFMIFLISLQPAFGGFRFPSSSSLLEKPSTQPIFSQGKDNLKQSFKLATFAKRSVLWSREVVVDVGQIVYPPCDSDRREQLVSFYAKHRTLANIAIYGSLLSIIPIVV
jgi:hypothetical protein